MRFELTTCVLAGVNNVLRAVLIGILEYFKIWYKTIFALAKYEGNRDAVSFLINASLEGQKILNRNE